MAAVCGCIWKQTFFDLKKIEKLLDSLISRNHFKCEFQYVSTSCEKDSVRRIDSFAVSNSTWPDWHLRLFSIFAHVSNVNEESELHNLQTNRIFNRGYCSGIANSKIRIVFFFGFNKIRNQWKAIAGQINDKMENRKIDEFLHLCCRVCLSVENVMVDTTDTVENFNKTIDELLHTNANMKVWRLLPLHSGTMKM